MRRVTLQSIAKSLGLHITTVSKALQGHPHIAVSTRERVRRQADKMGYTPDPMLTALSAYRTALRPVGFHAVLAWIHPHSRSRQATMGRFAGYSDYLAGAEARASMLGYRIEQFWIGDSQPDRLARILGARGIEGVVVAPSAQDRCELRAFPWEDFCAVSIGYSLRWPKLNMVTNDHFRTFLDIVHRLDEAGCRRIGCYLNASENRRMDERARSAWLAYSDGRDLPLLVYERPDRKEFLSWFGKHRCDGMITGERRVLGWLKSAGIKVPGEVRLAHYALPEGEQVLAGMHHNCLQSGKAAVDLLVSMLHRRERGVPDPPLRIMIESVWRDNRTVIPGRRLAVPGRGKS